MNEHTKNMVIAVPALIKDALDITYFFKGWGVNYKMSKGMQHNDVFLFTGYLFHVPIM